MLEANYSWNNPAITLFRETLTESDKTRLNSELDTYAKDLTSAMLFQTDYHELKKMLSEGEISPLLFQWAMAMREGMGPECEAEI